MHLSRFLVLIACLTFLSSCGGGGSDPVDSGRGGSGQSPGSHVPSDPYDPGQGTDSPKPFEWRLLYSYPDSYRETPLEAVARSEAEFAQLWQQCLGVVTGKLPVVDFEKEMVVAVFSGAYLGHNFVEITNIARFKQGDGVLVEYVHHVPGPTFPTPLPNAFGRGYCFAVADRVDAEVKFVKTIDVMVWPN